MGFWSCLGDVEVFCVEWWREVVLGACQNGTGLWLVWRLEAEFVGVGILECWGT